MKTMQLGGFMSRQWDNETGGGKFRKQIRRRAIRMGGAEAVEIRTEYGNLVDYIPSDAEAKACGYAVERNV